MVRLHAPQPILRLFIGHRDVLDGAGEYFLRAAAELRDCWTVSQAWNRYGWHLDLWRLGR